MKSTIAPSEFTHCACGCTNVCAYELPHRAWLFPNPSICVSLSLCLSPFVLNVPTASPRGRSKQWAYICETALRCAQRRSQSKGLTVCAVAARYLGGVLRHRGHTVPGMHILCALELHRGCDEAAMKPCMTHSITHLFLCVCMY